MYPEGMPGYFYDLWKPLKIQWKIKVMEVMSSRVGGIMLLYIVILQNIKGGGGGSWLIISSSNLLLF